MKTYKPPISEVMPHQVFVFGSNGQGFHGAGSAGFAMFGRSDNVWRRFNFADWPNGARGLYAIKGVARGIQEGNKGKSYAIQTVTRAGMKRSMSFTAITDQIKELYEYATANPELQFIIAGDSNMSKVGLNGYTMKELREMYMYYTPPSNIVFPEGWDIKYPLILTDDTHLTSDFNRIVVGARGSYIEFAYSHLVMPLMYKFTPCGSDITFDPPSQQVYLRSLRDRNCFYAWLYPKGKPDVKVYFQLQTVSYADYKVGRLYIAPNLVKGQY